MKRRSQKKKFCGSCIELKSEINYGSMLEVIDGSWVCEELGRILCPFKSYSQKVLMPSDCPKN